MVSRGGNLALNIKPHKVYSQFFPPLISAYMVSKLSSNFEVENTFIDFIECYKEVVVKVVFPQIRDGQTHRCLGTDFMDKYWVYSL